MTDKTQAETLRQEYRATMPADVLHLWAKDAIACIAELEALQASPPAPERQGLTTQQVEDVLLDAGLSQEMREAIIFDLVDAEAAGDQAPPAPAGVAVPDGVAADNRWCPDVCPITGRQFFMWAEHHDTGEDVPIYGGPFDSYTIPVKDEDGTYSCERYDHDLGGWREWESVGLTLVDDQSFVVAPENPRYDEIRDFAENAAPAAPAQAVAVPIDNNLLGEIIGCFDAALAEGLMEALLNTRDARLADLVTRRLMHAYYAAIGPSFSAPAQEHATQLAGQGVRAGFALVPLRLTPAMDEVLQEEGWQWADLLAAAKALTEADYDALSRDDLTDTEVFAVADPLFAHQQIGGRVPSQDLDGFRELIGSALSDAVFQAAAPAQAQEDAPVARAGLLAAAAHIRAKASAHAEECGSYDPDTGAFEMRDAVQDHYNTLDELAEEIRLMADKAAPASCDKPPAGWACSRAPGHVGPCAAVRAAQGGA